MAERDGKFQVLDKACDDCIYRSDSPLDLERLENEVRDPYVGFAGYRICHQTQDVCCRGFWNAHKDEFTLGQLAQRMDGVEFVPLEQAGRRKFRDE